MSPPDRSLWATRPRWSFSNSPHRKSAKDLGNERLLSIGGEIWSWYVWLDNYIHQMLAIIFMSIDLLVNFQLQFDMSQQKLNCLRHDKDTLGCEHSPIPIFASRKSPRMATKNLPKQATWLRFICFSCKSPMTSGLKNPPHMACNNFFWGDMHQVSSKTWQIFAGNQEMLRMSTFCIHEEVWLWNWSSKIHFFHENFPIGSIKKNINLQPIPPQRMPISLAQISLGCSQFFPPLIFKSQGGGVRFLQAVVGIGPQNTEMQRIFSPTNFRREVIGTHCANASIPDTSQRRPAGCFQDHSVQDKRDVYLIISLMGTKNIWWILTWKICVPNFAMWKVLVKDYCHFAYS